MLRGAVATDLDMDGDRDFVITNAITTNADVRVWTNRTLGIRASFGAPIDISKALLCAAQRGERGYVTATLRESYGGAHRAALEPY